MKNYLSGLLRKTALVSAGIAIGTVVTSVLYCSSVNKLQYDVDTIKQQLPRLKEENVFGGPESEIFLETQDGTRFYFAIDGKPVEEYFSAPVVYR